LLAPRRLCVYDYKLFFAKINTKINIRNGGFSVSITTQAFTLQFGRLQPYFCRLLRVLLEICGFGCLRTYPYKSLKSA
jgi:hypothetical protein